jgi:hypothetical protein
MDKLSEEDLGFITDLFRVDEKVARKVIDGKSFYNPLTEKLEDKSTLLAGDYKTRSDNIQNWINKEENRIRYFPGYDGIEPFIAFAKDTVEMIKTHHIEEEKRKTQEMKSTKASNAPTVLKQFDEMKAKHPDAILLFRVGDFYETYKQDAVKASQILGITTAKRAVDGQEIKIAGFPHHALNTYLPKLVRAGMRVAICEQLEDPKQKKVEKHTENNKEVQASKSEKPQLTDSAMPKKKKKEEAPEQEQPKAKVETKPEAKAEVKSEQKSETQQERKPREPQMVTVNGDKVTHGHAFQSKTNPEDWYFTAKINGEQLKPQKMDPADLADYQKKEMTVPQLMERYYPTKLMEKVPEVAYKTPNVIAGPESNLTVDKFNVYKEKDEQRPDFGKYKFYAEVGGQKMSTVAPREELNAYFDRVRTPGQLVERNFGERLHLSSHYAQFKLPEGVDASGVRVAKDRADGKWKVSTDLGEHGRTDKKEISFDDGYALFKTKTATREQIAAKYLNTEITAMLNGPTMKMEKSASMKM